MTDLNNTEDLLDVRDIIARVEELEDERAEHDFDDDGNRIGANNWLIDCTDDAAELVALSALLADMAGAGGDEEWRGDWYPVTLIRDSYFTDYAQDLVEECGYISKDFPSWIEVDWEATARNVRMDYTSTEFDGVTYWFR